MQFKGKIPQLFPFAMETQKGKYVVLQARNQGEAEARCAKEYDQPISVKKVE